MLLPRRPGRLEALPYLGGFTSHLGSYEATAISFHDARLYPASSARPRTRRMAAVADHECKPAYPN